MAKIITFSNFLGRAGSSTIAANVGFGLSNNEKNSKTVLYIDLNPNMGLTELLLFNQWNVDEKNKKNENVDFNFNINRLSKSNTSVDFFNTEISKESIKPIFFTEKLSIIPSHPNLMYLQQNYDIEDFYLSLKKCKSIDNFDYVIIDAPNMPSLQLNCAIHSSLQFFIVYSPSIHAQMQYNLLMNFFIPDFKDKHEREFPKIKIIANLVDKYNKKWLLEKTNYPEYVITSEGFPKSAFISHLPKHRKFVDRFIPITNADKRLSNKQYKEVILKIHKEMSIVTDNIINESSS